MANLEEAIVPAGHGEHLTEHHRTWRLLTGGLPERAARGTDKPRGETAMKTRFVRSMALPALLLAAFSACEGLLSDGGEQQRTQFTAANNRWDAANLSSYSYTLNLVCACGTSAELRAVVITVQNGVPVSRIYPGTPPTNAPASVFADYDTVEELFAAVEDAISGDADLLNVVYDPTYGVPLRLQVDPSTSDPDDHLAFDVTGFAPATAAN